jgi:Plasmid replication region DNA-binding N-term
VEQIITPTDSSAVSAFEARAAALRTRVADAARMLSEQGITPTVARLRAALGGGSPNDLAPALKHWRDAAHADSGAGPRGLPPAGRRIPPPIADLAQELWQRATVAAVLELKHGRTARDGAARTAEVDSLRTQLNAVRQHLERESLAYGELRAQAARHETIARHALAREQDADLRARDLLRELGEARQQIAQLAAELKQRPQPAHPAASPKGRNSARHNKRTASPSKRMQPMSRVRAASPPTQRPRAQKGSLRRSKKQSKIAARGKRSKVSGTGLTRLRT